MGVKQGTPQSEEVAAVKATQAAIKLQSTVLSRDPPMKVATAEAQAIKAAEAIGKAETSAAVAVAEVKAIEAAKAVEKKAGAEPERELVLATANLQHPKSNNPEVKAVVMARRMDEKKKADEEVEKKAVTDREQKQAALGRALMISKVVNAKSNFEKSQPKILTEKSLSAAEIRQSIEPAETVKQAATKAGLSRAVSALAESGGAVGKALARVIESKAKVVDKDESGNLLSKNQKEAAERQMQEDSRAMIPAAGKRKPVPMGSMKPKSNEALIKMEKSIQKEKIPLGGFQDAPDSIAAKAQENEAIHVVKTKERGDASEEEKVGLGIVIEAKERSVNK